MPIRSHDQSKGFAFITAPQHVTKKIVKLNDVQFQGNCLIVKEASLEEILVFDPILIVDHTLLTTLQKMKIPSQGTTLFLVISLMQVLLNLLKDLWPDIRKSV